MCPLEPKVGFFKPRPKVLKNVCKQNGGNIYILSDLRSKVESCFSTVDSLENMFKIIEVHSF